MMKTKYIISTALCILLVMMSSLLWGQNTADIVYGEYFFDTEVAYGEGEALVITDPDTVINTSFAIDIKNLPKGFHRLFVRFRDSNGKWTQTYNYPVIVQRDHVIKIVRGEYFFDTVGSFGSGTSLNLDTVSAITDVSQQLDISSLEPGFHRLFIRFQDNQGKWSQTYNYPVIVKDSEPKFIVRGEYFFQGNTEYGSGYEINLDSIGSILTVKDVLTEGVEELGPGDTTLFYRFQDNRGNWSHTYRDTICVNVVHGYYTIDTPVYCYGDSITVEYDGDTSQATFYWDLDGDGGTFDYQTSGGSFTFLPNRNVSGESYILGYRIESGICEDWSYDDSLEAFIPLILSLTVDEIGDVTPGTSDGYINISVSGGTPDYEFVWSRDGNIVSSMEDPDSLPEGVYVLQVTDENGCMISDTVEVMEVTSVEEQELRRGIKVYPNPAKDHLFLRIEFESVKDLHINLFNHLGNSIIQEELPNALDRKAKIDCSALPAGTYYLQMHSGEGGYTQKVVLIK